MLNYTLCISHAQNLNFCKLISTYTLREMTRVKKYNECVSYPLYYDLLASFKCVLHVCLLELNMNENETKKLHV